MSQAHLVAEVVAATGLPKKAVLDVMHAAGAIVTSHLAAGAEATLPGLGKLVTEQRSARIGRNPLTGEKIKIAAKRVVRFRATGELKAAVQEAK